MKQTLAFCQWCKQCGQALSVWPLDSLSLFSYLPEAIGSVSEEELGPDLAQ